MNELETMQRAKMYMEKLAAGIDPISGRVMSQDAALQNPRLSRCFQYVAGLIGRMAEAEAAKAAGQPQSEKTPEKPSELVTSPSELVTSPSELVTSPSELVISEELVDKIPVSEEPVSLNDLVKNINGVLFGALGRMMTISMAAVWLEKEGFLEQRLEQGAKRRVVTQPGSEAGLFTETHEGSMGKYGVLMCGYDVQVLILENLEAILQR